MEKGKADIMGMVLRFSQIRKEDVAPAGGKGANLGEMTQAGIAVPQGFVLTSSAYRDFIKENDLDKVIEERLSGVKDEQSLLLFAKDLRERIRKGTLPGALVDEIAGAYSSLGENVRVAVRSSATAEDLPDASFAGQQETYLNVRGPEEVCEKIRDCYASLWGNRAVVYRHNQGYDQRTVALAVVIQEMVESEKAGVLFTANPVTGNKDQIQINSSYGLGESVVSGRVTADSLVCDKAGRILTTYIGSKQTKIVYTDEAETGTKEIPVPQEEAMVLSLSEEEVSRLCAAGISIEQHYGMPMDIEWAIRGGEIFILQARAITTLKKNEDIPEAEWKKYMKPGKISGSLKTNFSFLLEKMNTAFLPFDWDICKVINMQKSVIFSEGGIELDMQPGIDDNGIMCLPPNTKKLTGRIFKLPAIIKEIKDSPACKQKMEELMAGYKKELAVIENTDFESMDLKTCGEEISHLVDMIRRILYGRFKYAMFAQMLLSRSVGNHAGKVDPSFTSFDILRDLDNETAVFSRDIQSLADLVAENKDMKADILDGMNYEDLRKKYPVFADAADSFIKAHGFKTDMNTYCLMSRSYYEEPERLLNIIKPLLSDKAAGNLHKEDPSAVLSYADILEKLQHIYSPKKFEKAKEQIEYTRYFHVVREESQYYWEEVFYYIKKAMKRFSLLTLHTDNYLNTTAYLFVDEVTDACARGGLSKEDKEKIERRRGLRPVAVKVWDETKMSAFDSGTDVLKGVAGSAGKAMGRVCIISGPEEFYKLNKGDILVCRLTDPEWTPLFTIAAGVVADTGAELSHAAIVAREYGIPAVLGVGFATTKFHDGDMISVDGSIGEVKKIG